MSIRLGFHRHGNCWSVFRFSQNTYYAGEMTWLGWWRLFMVFDRRGS